MKPKREWRVEYEIPPLREVYFEYVIATSRDKAMGLFYTKFQNGERVRKIELVTS